MYFHMYKNSAKRYTVPRNGCLLFEIQITETYWHSLIEMGTSSRNVKLANGIGGAKTHSHLRRDRDADLDIIQSPAS